MNILEYIQKAQAFDLLNGGREAITIAENEILRVWFEQTYIHSLDGDGNPLRSPYSNFRAKGENVGYRDKKFKMRGKEITDLYLSGELFESMEIIVEGDTWTMYSDVEYFDKLQEWAGAPIYTLSLEGQLEIRIHFLLPEIRNAYRVWMAA